MEAVKGYRDVSQTATVFDRTDVENQDKSILHKDIL